MKALPWIKHASIQKIIANVVPDKQFEFTNFLLSFIDQTKTVSSFLRNTELLYDLYKMDNTNYNNLFYQYKTESSQYKKLIIRYGPEIAIEYKNKLQKRVIKNRNSIFKVSYWIDKVGLSLEDATLKVKEIQQKNANTNKLNRYKNHAAKLKFSTQYWINLGYSLAESEILRLPYLEQTKHTLSIYINKYGPELGPIKFNEYAIKQKEAVKNSVSNKQNGGYVSKSSLKLFIPLYKFARRLGINKSDIFIGITGSREYFLKSNNKFYFYDFTIKSINLIIEYHGIYWHPRKDIVWRNKNIDYNDKLNFDIEKASIARNNNMQYIIVWEDSDYKIELENIKNIIKLLKENTNVIS